MNFVNAWSNNMAELKFCTHMNKNIDSTKMSELLIKGEIIAKVEICG